MEGTDEVVKTRELGLEFGDLAYRIADQNYPVMSTDFVSEFGDHKIESSSGDQTLNELFQALEVERFDSPDDVRQAIFNLVDEGAIGRKCYSDRTPPALGEKTEWTPESL